MKNVKKSYEVLSNLSAGKLYSWQDLKTYSHSPGRDVNRLVNEGLLHKVGPGLYLVPKAGRFGSVPAGERELVSRFLDTDDFLVFSVNLYNTLGLGLTQLKNEVVVYNHKRHGIIHLSNRVFHFKRPNNSFPDKLTKEFLLVDLMNNLKNVGENESELKLKVARTLSADTFDKKLLFDLVNEYGKVGTKKFFSQFNH